jgi:hypothetical protein
VTGKDFESSTVMRAHLLTLVLLSAFFAACNSKELTRAKAKKIIESSDLYQLKPQRVYITRDEAINLVNHKYCLWQGFGVFQLSVAPKGKPYFQSAGGEPMTFANPFTEALFVVPVKPLRPRIVEITGISEGADGTKIVEYQWQWDASTQVPKVTEMLFTPVAVHEDAATFKLYDDGWRITQWGRKSTN